MAFHTHFLTLVKSRRLVTAILVGVFAVLFTSSPAKAETIDVSASVLAPLPSDAAVILSPIDQTHFNEPTITVTGTCPTEGAYVVIVRGDIPAGVAACEGGGFTLSLSLLEGANPLTALVYNSTDNPGPASPVVTVFYDPPVHPPPSDTPPTSNPSATILTPLLPQRGPSTCLARPIIFSYEPYSPVQNKDNVWTWKLTIRQGCPPYKLTINWGDGVTEVHELHEDGSYTFTHIYNRVGTFYPNFTVTDSRNTSASLQLLAIIDSKLIDAFPDTAAPAQTDPIGMLITSGLLIAGGVIGLAVAIQIVRLRVNPKP